MGSMLPLPANKGRTVSASMCPFGPSFWTSSMFAFPPQMGRTTEVPDISYQSCEPVGRYQQGGRVAVAPQETF